MPKNDDSNSPGAKEEANFIANMKRLREENDWSQGEMARRMSEAGWESFHQTTISRIEKGERPVRLGEARGIASVLGALVGQMILPTSGSKALRDLELRCQETREAARTVAEAVETYMFSQTLIRKALEDLEDADLGEDADSSVTQRRATQEAIARNRLAKSYLDVIDEHFKSRNGVTIDGVNPEEA